MSRETYEFTTPLGRKVVLNKYLTGREAQALKSLLAGAMKISTDGASVENVSASLVLDTEEKAMQYLIVSFDGNTTNPIDALMNECPSSEYEAVIGEINKIQNPTKPQK